MTCEKCKDEMIYNYEVEERNVVSETIESVRCRWCNAVDQVELVDRPGAGS